MIGLIPRPLHGVLDYLWSLVYWFAPEMLGFADDQAATVFSKIRAGSMVPAGLMTRYELGLIKIIPFNVHLLLDLGGALVGLAAPWLLGFAKNEKARNATLGFALVELTAVLFSKRDPQ